jgi:ABC-2 type transport system ATP-binding protein
MLLTRAGIERWGERLAGRLSGGQRRKLAGAMALLPEPRLLVLDEVTTGVDPVSRMELWRLVAGAAATGTAVLAATTYLDEAERAKTVDLLHEGRVLASGDPSAIVAAAPGRVTDEETPIDRARAWRRGRRWRQWHPAEEAQVHDRPTLEDAAIVLELVAEEGGS